MPKIQRRTDFALGEDSFSLTAHSSSEFPPLGGGAGETKRQDLREDVEAVESENEEGVVPSNVLRRTTARSSSVISSSSVKDRRRIDGYGSKRRVSQINCLLEGLTSCLKAKRYCILILCGLLSLVSHATELYVLFSREVRFSSDCSEMNLENVTSRDRGLFDGRLDVMFGGNLTDKAKRMMKKLTKEVGASLADSFLKKLSGSINNRGGEDGYAAAAGVPGRN